MVLVNPAEEAVWGLLIATYPFITGIVAGAFIVSVLAHVFGKTKYLPIIGLAMITALSFLVAAPIPLILDLGRPERAINIFLTPSPTSAMAIFGYLLLTLLALYLVESFLIFRPGFGVKAKSMKGGVLKPIYRALSGSPEANAKGELVLKGLLLISVPLAAVFHMYVGFIFGSLKAREFWATPITPLAFLASAVVSGIALVSLLYGVFGKNNGKTEILNGLMKILGWAIIFDMAFILSEFSFLGYTSLGFWPAVIEISLGALLGTVLVQLAGAILPLILISSSRIRKSTGGVILVSIIALAGIFAYRWNIVIGGQMIPKLQTEIITYTLVPFDIYASVFSVMLAFIILGVLAYLLPWRELEANHVAVTTPQETV